MNTKASRTYITMMANHSYICILNNIQLVIRQKKGYYYEYLLVDLKSARLVKVMHP